MYDFNNIRESVGKKIKDKRTSFDLTQEQLAEKLGVSKGSISSWEKGRTAPRMDKVSQMAEIFNVPWSYFVSESEETSLSTPLPPTPSLGSLHRITKSQCTAAYRPASRSRRSRT